MLVRSWNLFHGNSYPPRRRSYLRQMVELVVADEPDVVCLQEVPVWALGALPRWSDYSCHGAIARQGLRPSGAAGWITRRHQGLLRSAVTGQANAMLVRRGLTARALGQRTISMGAKEPRIAHAVELPDLGVIVNLHASQAPGDAIAEVGRARVFACTSARPGAAVVLAGDFNTRCALTEFSEPGPGIDHIVVKGRAATHLHTWPLDRRVQNDVVLSDHAPVELTIE